MGKTLIIKSSCMNQLFKKRNKDIIKEERHLASLNMYENYICQYKAIICNYLRKLQFFTIKHGQFAAVELTRSGTNKMLRKAWEAFITQRDKNYPERVCQKALKSEKV